MKGKVMMIRMSDEEKELLREKASEFNFDSVSEYLRFLGLSCKKIDIKIEKKGSD